MVASDGEGSKRPANTPFKQQTLKAWRPILTPKAVIIAFAAIGVIFVPMWTLALGAELHAAATRGRDAKAKHG